MINNVQENRVSDKAFLEMQNSLKLFKRINVKAGKIYKIKTPVKKEKIIFRGVWPGKIFIRFGYNITLPGGKEIMHISGKGKLVLHNEGGNA